VRNLGKRLKALRKEQGLTLVQLGEKVDLSASYLSQIERGVAMPSLPRLAALARVLGVEVVHFFEDQATFPRVVRSNQRKRIKKTTDMTVELLSAHLSGKKILPCRVVCQPGALRERFPIGSGEEVCFVLKGQLTVTVGEETFVLSAGDSIHCSRYQPRSWRNEGDKECVVIWAVSPPISEEELVW